MLADKYITFVSKEKVENSKWKSKSGKVKLDIQNHSNMGLERKLKLISNSMNFYTNVSKWYTLRIFFRLFFWTDDFSGI